MLCKIIGTEALKGLRVSSFACINKEELSVPASTCTGPAQEESLWKAENRRLAEALTAWPSNVFAYGMVIWEPM
jgi:hypothetical protein